MSITSAASAISQGAHETRFATGAPSGVEGSGKSRITPTAAQDFEAFVLQSFVEAMLPRESDSVFGEGTSGALWKSMLAEQVARELARSGGIGIARMIEKDLAT